MSGANAIHTSPAAAGFRPWSLFLSTSALSLPVSFTEATFRIRQNFRYFLPNYVGLGFLVLALSLLTRPLSLILFLCIFAAWIYLVFASEDTISVLNYEADRKIIVGFLGVLTLGAVLWTGIWFKLFISVVIGTAIVIVHGALRAPENDSPYGSLLHASDNPMGDYSDI